MKKQHMTRRDFGGSKKTDWHTLHDSIDPSKGLTKREADTIASFLRIIGNTVKLDPLGGGGRLGVYYRKKKGSQEIKIHTIPPDLFKEWFRNQIGTETGPVYESTVSNFIAQNPHLITGSQNKQVKV